jgi:dihydroneopterin aldolase
LTIHIKALTFEAIIGILESERKKPQKVVIDIDMEYTFIDGDFINYAVVVQEVEERVKRSGYYLLEEAIIDIEKSIVDKYKKLLKSLHIEIKKPDILNNCIVSLSKVKNF